MKNADRGNKLRRRKNACSWNKMHKLQKGLAALEFALVFPLFFLLFYAIVTYGIIFVAQQLLTLSAAEGARAALTYNTTLTPGVQACTTAQTSAQLMLSSVTCTTTQTQASATAPIYMKVVLTYPYISNPLVPLLPGFGLFVPTNLVSSATVQLEPSLS